jgi:hypothetical protein
LPLDAHAEHHFRRDREQQQSAGDAEGGEADRQRAQQPVAVWGLLALTLTVSFSTTAFAQFSLTLQPNSLPAATQGTAYSVTITALGGTAPYIFVFSGTLPAGLTLTTGGVLSGTPTASGSPSFQIQATDSGSNTGFRTYRLNVGTPGSLGINPATLPNGFQGTAYSQTLTGTGGTGPYTFTLTSGALPNGLTLSSGGVISGTPTTGGLSTSQSA